MVARAYDIRTSATCTHCERDRLAEIELMDAKAIRAFTAPNGDTFADFVLPCPQCGARRVTFRTQVAGVVT